MMLERGSSEIARDEARRQSIRFMLPAACLFVLASHAALALFVASSLNAQFGAIEGQLRQIVQSGDQFQARRLVASLSGSPLIKGAKLEIKSGKPSESQLSTETIGWPRVEFAVRDLGLGHPAASLILSVNIPWIALAVQWALLAAFAAFFFRWTQQSHARLASKLASPIELFALAVERESDSELSGVIGEKAETTPRQGYRELNDAIEKVRGLIERVRDLERTRAETTTAHALASLAAQVAHDIRSPLSALITVASRLRHAHPAESALLDGCSKRIITMTDEILRSTGRSRLVSQAEITSSLDASAKTETRVDAGTLDRLLRQVIEEVRASPIATPGRRIIYESLDCDHSFELSGEAHRIVATAVNLVRNGLEALSAEGGFVRVSFEVSRFGSRLRVVDNGIGIHPDDLKQIGTRGWTKGKEGGNGLGLHHAFLDCERWGARIGIKSTVGFGTEILIDWPPLTPSVSRAHTTTAQGLRQDLPSSASTSMT